MSAVRVDIECPVCEGGIHRYDLTPVMSKVAHYAGEGEARKRTFTRIFTCVKKGTAFQATISVPEPAGFRVKGVHVSHAGAAHE